MTYFNKYNLRTNDMVIFNPFSTVICIHLTKFEFARWILAVLDS